MNSPRINNELREGILGYRSFERNLSKYNKSLVDGLFILLDANSLSPNGRIPWRKRINAREGDPSGCLMLS